MKEEIEINKLMVVFALLSDGHKLKFMDMAIKNMKSNRDLAGEVCQMAERAYHPMLDIELWMEGRFTKHPSYPPKRVISECVIANKLSWQMEPLLWGLARKVKKRVIRRIERKEKENV